MTANAIVALTGGAQLTEVERMVLAEMGHDTAAFDMQPARVKIAPGGIGQFLLGEETAKGFTAIVALSQKVRGYWPAAGTGNPPMCSSPDGVTGVFPDPTDADFKAAMTAVLPHPGIVALAESQPVPQAFACGPCPLNQWGSEHQRRTGKGRACKEMRRLLLLIDGWTLPALMALPPTSIKAWDAYASGLAAKRSAYFAVRTRFELDKATAAGGETYNIVKVTFASAITDPAALRLVSDIRRQYREYVSATPVEATEYETAPAAEAVETLPF
jgi:hypothetical protein